MPLTYPLNMPVFYLQSFIFQNCGRNINEFDARDHERNFPDATSWSFISETWCPQNANHSTAQSATSSQHIRVRSQWGWSSGNEVNPTIESSSGICLSAYCFVFIPADVNTNAVTASSSSRRSTALRTSSSVPVRYSASSITNTSCSFLSLLVSVQASDHTKQFLII